MAIANVALGSSESGAGLVVGAANGTAVVSMVLCNTDTVARTITVYAKATYATGAGVLNTILSALSLDAGETYVFNDKIMLAQNNVITAKASSASVVGMTISYLDL